VPDAIGPPETDYPAPVRVARPRTTTKLGRAMSHQATGGTSAATLATAVLVLVTAAVSALKSRVGLAACSAAISA